MSSPADQDGIHHMIQNCPLIAGHEDEMNKMLNIMERLNDRIARLEIKLDAMDKEQRRAANVASCLANGIVPD